MNKLITILGNIMIWHSFCCPRFRNPSSIWGSNTIILSTSFNLILGFSYVNLTFNQSDFDSGSMLKVSQEGLFIKKLWSVEKYFQFSQLHKVRQFPGYFSFLIKLNCDFVILKMKSHKIFRTFEKYPMKYHISYNKMPCPM